MTKTPTLDRRGFLKGAGALAAMAALGCSTTENGRSEDGNKGIFNEVMTPRESSNGVVYIAGTERKIGDNIERALETPLFMYQIGTAGNSLDSTVLCMVTGVVPMDRASTGAGYSNLVLPGKATLLEQSGTGRQLFNYALRKRKGHENVVAYRFYKFLLEGLDKDNKYNLSHSDMFHGGIKTIDENNYKVLVGGDLGQHYSPKRFWAPSEQVNEFVSGMKDIDFAIPLGDFVAHDNMDLWLTQYLELYGSLQSMPVFPVKGNHDQSTNRTRGGMKMSSHPGFTNMFGAYGQHDDLLISGDSADVVNYSFDRGNVHFVVLDSCRNKRYNNNHNEAKAFLKRDLKAAYEKNPDNINLVFAHHPFPITPGPLLDGTPYKVHAVFSGHTHEYGRHIGPEGTHYIRTGGMGANLHKKRKQWHYVHTDPKKYRKSLQTEVGRTPVHHATILHYNNGHLDMTVKSVDDKVVDQVRLS